MGEGERRTGGADTPLGRGPENAEAAETRPGEPARLAPATGGTDLAGLFGQGPFARLDGFDGAVVRERSPHRDAPGFAPDAG